MRIGVGLPSTIPGAPASLTLDWARRADAGPFATLAALDRLVYDSFDSADRARRRRRHHDARAPRHHDRHRAALRATALAKTAASLDALSGGRLTLGLAVGARPDDYDAAGVDYATRGRRLVEQLTACATSGRTRATARARSVQRGRSCCSAAPATRASRASPATPTAMCMAAVRHAPSPAPPTRARAAWDDLGRPGGRSSGGRATSRSGEEQRRGGRALPARLLRLHRAVRRAHRRGAADHAAGHRAVRAWLRRRRLRRADPLPDRRRSGAARPAGRGRRAAGRRRRARQSQNQHGRSVMKITILGAGPAGLYCRAAAQEGQPARRDPRRRAQPADATYGWGVVFSDRTLASFQEADYTAYEPITEQLRRSGTPSTRALSRREIRCGGHVIAGIARKRLLGILQERCRELGVALEFEREIDDLADLGDYDLLIAADGVNSLARQDLRAALPARASSRASAKYIWLAADKVLDAFTFIFHESEHGLFQVHAYPFSGTTSTFIVECDEETWRRAGLDHGDEAESIAYCERLFARRPARRRAALEPLATGSASRRCSTARWHTATWSCSATRRTPRTSPSARAPSWRWRTPSRWPTRSASIDATPTWSAR